ncbi:hypothetical protein [Thalassospira povalilytica]|uniref:hypothetical protein n=1 Tax=Thalassospira povalilytica TaxID=732237 RepID=UPI001D1987E5|nr:hypothetical protein [Thalassospira povalilytica]MCC4240398.1 hypothetical protein [Thalassospira povalilytica]
MRPTEVDERWKEWATPKQAEAIDAVLKHGTVCAAAKALGIAQSNVSEKIKLARKKAASKGYAPDHGMRAEAAPGFSVSKRSVARNKDGEIIIDWQQEKPDANRQRELLEQWVESVSADIPRLKPLPAPEVKLNDRLLNMHVITDYHFGMLAWHREGGANWDLAIAEQMLIKAFRHMIQTSPPAESCVIAQLGDFLHFDGLLPVTPASGHVLDADGRFQKIVDVAVRASRAIIDLALQKYKNVHLVWAEGNHDTAGSSKDRVWLAALYENEPRLTIDQSAKPYYVHQFGKTMLGFHHGHLAKPSQLPGIFAAEFASIWGTTEYRYAHCGHLHHKHELRDYPGMTVDQHRTLAAKDAYSSRHGYAAPRSADTITYHREYGQCWSATTSPEMVA